MPVDPLLVDDIVQVVLYTKVHNQQCLNVLHYRVKTITTPKPYFEQLDDLMVAVGTAGVNSIVGKMLACQSEEAQLVWTQSQAVYPVRRPYSRLAHGQPGEVAVPCHAQNVSAVLTKQVERPGRGASGSFHVAGVPDDAYEAGSLKPAYVLLVDDLGEKLVEELNAGPGAMTLTPVTFRPGAVPPDHINPVINVFPQTTLRVMRRRTVGLGI